MMQVMVELGELDSGARAPSANDEAARAHRVEAMFDAHYDAIWRTLRRLGVAEAGADGVAAPLGTAPEVIDLLVDRFAQSR